MWVGIVRGEGYRFQAGLVFHHGEDNPAQMIALCPNCHKIKTLGRTRKELIPVLFTAARQRHAQLARTPPFLS
jgi:hypothetical protein